ncbi:MAG: DUF4444 domain-containing protein [Pseudomonadota bacterium]
MSAAAAPTFPPLLQGMGLRGAQDPFEVACAQAALGCDAGLVVYNVSASHLRAAIVFAPEAPLRQAVAAMIVCGVGFQNALGALAPPEVAVHLDWDGGIRVNGASCGGLAVNASSRDAETVPDWIVVGLTVPLKPKAGTDPGADPERTWLSEEGCVEVAPETLLEAWARHTLLWVNRWLDEGARPLHAVWRGLAHGRGEPATFTIAGRTEAGTFVGVDEDFGLLLRTGQETRLVPLTELLNKGEQP